MYPYKNEDIKMNYFNVIKADSVAVFLLCFWTVSALLLHHTHAEPPVCMEYYIKRDPHMFRVCARGAASMSKSAVTDVTQASVGLCKYQLRSGGDGCV